MADLKTTTFDYTTLPAGDRVVVQSCATEVHEFVRKTGRDAHRIGLKLVAVKKLLGHGRFLAWVRAEFKWSADTAGRLMKVAERFTEIPHRAEIGQSALYLLAGDDVPEEARREALARAEGGEAIPKSVARTIADRHRGPQNGGTGDSLTAGEESLDAGAPAVPEDSADIVPDSPAESPSDTAPANIITAEVAVSSADTVAAIPQEIDVGTGVPGDEKPITMPDLDILIVAAWSLVASGGTDIGPAVRRTVRGWPAERRAELARQAAAFGRHMTAASELLARAPRPVLKDGEQEANR